MKKLFTLLTFMVVTVATYGYTDLVDQGYTPGSGNTFSETVSITNWDTQAIVASINVSKCTNKQNEKGNDINEEILAIGNENFSYYSGYYYKDKNGSEAETDVIHFYFHHNASGEGGTLQVIYFYGTGENSRVCAKLAVTSDELLIRVTKAGGVYVNGVSFNYASSGTYNQGDSFNDSDAATKYSEIWGLSTVYVGCPNGGSNATYNYIRVLDKTAAFGTDATKSTNWNYQELVASINVSGCSNGKNSKGNDINDEILSIGNVIGKYSAEYNKDSNNNRLETDVIHFYFHHNAAGEGGQLEVIYFYGTSEASKVRAKKNVDSDDLLIKFSKGFGVTVNGESFNFTSSNTYNTGDSITGDVSSYYSEIFALSNTYIGCPDGSYAAYNSVELKSLMTLDESANNADMISHFNNTAVNTVLKRTLTVNEWNTFCVPFDIPSSNALLNSSFCTVKEYDKVDGTTMHLKTATEIKAGTPYLVKPTVAISNPRFENVTVAATSPEPVGSDTYKFVGLYSTKEFNSDETSTSYILVSGGNLVNPTASTMKGMRAYFTCTGKAGVAPRVDIDGVETALSEVVGNDEVTDGRIYNLRGMYVGNDSSRLAKGIYIMNGKKVVLK